MSDLHEDLTALATHIRKKAAEVSLDSHARADDWEALVDGIESRVKRILAAHAPPSEAATEPEGVAMSQSSVQGLSGKWLAASRTARKAEMHFPADCLAEAAHVVQHLTAELDAARSAQPEGGTSRPGGCGVCVACDPPAGGFHHRMYVCGTCSNKRCPAAGDCLRWECSGTNDPNQGPPVARTAQPEGGES